MNEKIYLIFDIETSPIPYETFSESQQEYLIRGAKTDEEIEKKKSEMALTPLTSQVVTIGMKIVEKKNDSENYAEIKSVALMTNPNLSDEDEPILEKENDITFYQTSEKNVLDMFWRTIEKYKGCILISFNGRNFDAPFLMIRSAILGIRPSKNLMEGTKFNYPSHIDLIDELTFYSPSSYGATKRFNFDFYTRAFGLVSPKGEGIDGSLVSVFFEKEEYKTIADYCLRDVDATWKLFLRIKDYLFIK